ncbi:STAS domain-containing protein [Pedobacter sp. JCM 36344]|uniref:STAS domain-containing protein n=1 Tax=Pedobacter sp. JCM 36344 TaxID=3374280 RepID=UPI0039789754
MNVKKQNIDDLVLLTIVDKDANLTKSENFKEIVFKEIESGTRKLIISFEHVEYLDSSFLGALVAILKNLVPKNGRLILIELNNDIRNLFELTRLDKIFELKNSLETAIEDFK